MDRFEWKNEPEFTAVDDNGRQYRIQHLARYQILGDGSRLRLISELSFAGRHVEYRSPGVYEIQDNLNDTRTRITSKDPNAP